MTAETHSTPSAPLRVVNGFVPVIDLSDALSGDNAARQAAATLIGATCESSGFFVITGHGVPSEVIRGMLAATKRFFALPRAQKMQVLSEQNDPLMRGYGRDGNVAAAAPGKDPTLRMKPDLAETYTISRLGEAEGTRNMSADVASLVGYPNKWPELENFQSPWLAYYQAMTDLAAEIMRLFALALDLEENWFNDKIDRHMTNLTANYYPAQPEPPEPGQLRKGEHSDWGSLTILSREEAPGGLQVRMPTEEWLDVPDVPNAFVINIGDLMSVWTNNRWVSTRHRVINPPRHQSHRARYSLAFFHQPNFDTLIECLPGCASKTNPPTWLPVRSGDYILEKFRLAYG